MKIPRNTDLVFLNLRVTTYQGFESTEKHASFFIACYNYHSKIYLNFISFKTKWGVFECLSIWNDIGEGFCSNSMLTFFKSPLYFTRFNTSWCLGLYWCVSHLEMENFFLTESSWSPSACYIDKDRLAELEKMNQVIFANSLPIWRLPKDSPSSADTQTVDLKCWGLAVGPTHGPYAHIPSASPRQL